MMNTDNKNNTNITNNNTIINQTSVPLMDYDIDDLASLNLQISQSEAHPSDIKNIRLPSNGGDHSTFVGRSSILPPINTNLPIKHPS